MTEKVIIKRIRSRQDRMKEQIQQLTRITNHYIYTVNIINDVQLNEISYDYLSWVIDQLANNKRKKEYNQLEQMELIKRIKVFKKKIIYHLKLCNTTSSSIMINRNYTTIDNLFNFAQFLEFGLKMVPTLLDPNNLWLQKETLFQIIQKDKKGLLTHVFYALLAKLTLPQNSPSYKVIYSNSLKNIRLLLPIAYQIPSCNNVIALSLLSYLALSHSKFELVERYYFSAVRMGEVLGYNSKEKSIDCIDQVSHHNTRGKNIWNMLYLGYITYSNAIIDFPAYKFDIDQVDLVPYLNIGECRFLEVGQSEENTKYERHQIFLKKVVAINLFIIQHTLNIKHKKKELISIIKNEEVKLSSSEFNQQNTILMSLNLELNNNKIVNKNTQLNVYNYFQLLVNTSLILLYYPILQLIPKPVKFSKEENELLLNLVDMSFEIIFKSDNKDSTINEVDNPLTEIKVLIAGIEKKQTIISCAQFAIFIYVYWNIIYILKDEEVGVGYNEITNNCKERSLTILNVIKQVSIKSKKEVRNDARLSLIELNRALNRFQLPLDYVEKVNNVMNN